MCCQRMYCYWSYACMISVTMPPHINVVMTLKNLWPKSIYCTALSIQLLIFLLPKWLGFPTIISQDHTMKLWFYILGSGHKENYFPIATQPHISHCTQ